MKKYIVAIVLLLVFSIGNFIYRYHMKPFQWERAEENLNKYIDEQGVVEDNIESIAKDKELSYEGNNHLRGILYTIKYKDEPQYEYEYFFDYNMHSPRSYNIVMKIYDLDNDRKELKGEELKNVNYPPIYLMEKN